MAICPKCGREITEGTYFCGFCGTKLDAAPSNDLRKIVERRLEAIQAKNESILEDIIDSNLYTKFDDWPPFTRQEAEEALKNEKSAYKVLSNYNFQIEDFQGHTLDGTAFTTFHIHYTGIIRNRPFDIRSRVTLVLKRDEQSWKMVHEHWSSFPQEQKRKGLFG